MYNDTAQSRLTNNSVLEVQFPRVRRERSPSIKENLCVNRGMMAKAPLDMEYLAKWLNKFAKRDKAPPQKRRDLRSMKLDASI